MSTTRTARPTKARTAPKDQSPAGRNGTLNGHGVDDDQPLPAVEGSASPQAMPATAPTDASPAGNGTARPAIPGPVPKGLALAGHQNGRDHTKADAQSSRVPASSIPGAQKDSGAHHGGGTGDQHPSVAIPASASNLSAPLADPLLALAADVLGDLEKVRIANENRLRQLTRSTEDSDGELRGFGLDEAHPDVARLAALVDMLAQAEHQATLNLGRLMRKHPLGPWVKAQKGVGEKQAARLLAAIGDPYMRPEIVREDGTVEPSRPRLVSELWAFCGYHVVKVPVSGQSGYGTQGRGAADGSGIPADQAATGAHMTLVGGELNGHPGQIVCETHDGVAGVAPKRARGQKANWSSSAKMRAFLVAESCIKQMDGHYRTVYDATRVKYADAVHATECVRCGPSGKPAQPGSPLSDGHKHARALRAVAKEILRDLWREAKRIHEQAPVSDHAATDTHWKIVADGTDIPAGHPILDTHSRHASGEQCGT